MAFPAVRAGHDTTSFPAAAATWGVVMPSTVAADDMLLVLVNVTAEAFRTVTAPAGWTQRKRYTYGFYGTMEAWTKDTVAGTEDSTTVNFTIDTASTGNAVAMAISGTSGDMAFSDPIIVDSFTTAPNPPSLSSGFGTVDTLWLAWATGRDDDATFSGWPTNYSHAQIQAQTGHAWQNITTGVAARQLAAASEDPAAFTLDEAEYCGAVTIAIKPAAAGTVVLDHTPTGGVEWSGAATVVLPSEVAAGGATAGVDTNVRLLVDTDGDGDFSEAVEDWTSYVLDAQLSTGKDYPSQLSGRVTPGRARVLLNNTDGRFDYFRTSSPLNTGDHDLKSGKLVRFQVDEAVGADPVELVRDRFDGVGAMGTTEDGHTWLAAFGAAFERSGDLYVSASADGVATVDAGVTDAYAQTRIRHIDPPNGAGLVYRWQNASNYGLIIFAEDELRHRHVVSGVSTIVSVHAVELREVMALGAYVEGTAIQVLVDGVALFTASEAFPAVGTQWGIYTSAEAHRDPKFHDFRMWNKPWVPRPGVIWTGDLTKIAPLAAEGGTRKLAVLEAEGQLSRMAGADIIAPRSVGVTPNWPGATAGLMIGATLAELDMIHPPPGGGLDAGDVTLGPVAIEPAKAIDIARRFEATELGLIRELPEGPVMFDSRSARDDPTPVAVFSDTGAGYAIERLELLDWRREIINRAEARVAPALPTLVATHTTSGTAAASNARDIDVTLPDASDDVNVGDLFLVSVVSSVHTDGVPFLRPTGWEMLTGSGDAQGQVRWYAKRVEAGDLGDSVKFYDDTGPSGGNFIARVFHISGWLGDIQAGIQIAQPAMELYSAATAGGQGQPVLVSSWGTTPALLIAYRSGSVSLANLATTVSFTIGEDEPAGYDRAISSKVEGVGENTFDIASQVAFKEAVFSIEHPSAWGGTFDEFDFVETGVVAVRGYLGDPPESGGESVTVNDYGSQRSHRAILTNPTIPTLFNHVGDAEDYCDLILERFSQDRPLLRLTFHASRSVEHRVQAYTRRVGDQIRVISSTDAIDDLFFIERISHQFSQGDRRWVVTWELSQTTVSLETTIPDPIDDLSAAAGDGSVLLTWTEPDDGGSPITGYDIERSSTSATSGFASLAADIDPATSYIDTTPTNGTEYWFRVRASNAIGDANAWSNVDSATPAEPGDVPEAVDDLAATAGAGQVSLAWTAPASTETIDTYDIQRSTTSSEGPWVDAEIDLAATTSHVDTGLTGGVEYWYRIRATSSEGDGPWSNIDSATPSAAPDGISIGSQAEDTYTGTSSTTLAVDMPATVDAGDLIITVLSTQESTDVGAPTMPGFTQAFTNTPSAAFQPRVTCLYKVAVGNEDGTTVTATWGTTCRPHAVTTALPGVDNSTPFDAAAPTAVTGGANLDPAAITTVTDDAWVVTAYAGNASPTPAVTGPAGYSTFFSQVPDDRAIVMHYLEKATAGAENPGAYSWAVDNGTVRTFALRSAGGGGGDPDPTGTPAPSIPAFSADTTITTGQNIKTIVEAASEGDHILIQAGTHTTANNVTIKVNNLHIRLATGAILEGSGLGYCFRPQNQSITGTVIGGDPGGARPIIRNYGLGTSSQEFAAIMGRVDDPLNLIGDASAFIYQDVDDWFIYHLDLNANASQGIKLGSNWTVYDVESRRHTVAGINGDRFVGGLIHSCVLHGNALSPAGGSSANGANIKVTWVNADVGRTAITPIDRAKAPFVVSNCTFDSFDQAGGAGSARIGFWADLDCQDVLVEHSSFDDHSTTSLFAEGCNGVQFDRNTVRNSDGFGPTFDGNFANAAISFGESTNCTASNNTIVDSTYAMMNRMSNRTSDWYNSNNGSFVNYAWPSGPRYWLLATQAVPAVGGRSNMWTGRNYFLNNTLINCSRVVINEGTDGGGQVTHGSTPVSGADKIDFQGNDYSGSSGILFYDRSLTGVNLATWQGLGYDV